ncbi:putative RNA-directed DNA polymerase [Helianthus annuus]|nr:putative RNA-directed DNA polymerase [Helianthus annuus]
MRCKLPSSAWGHAILHAAALIRLRPTADHECSPLQLVSGREPSLSHLRIFGCAVYVPILPPQRTTMGAQRRLGIYIGFNSPSIIKYLEPMTGDMFTALYADCHFDETMFIVLGGDKDKESLVTQEITWNVSSLSNLDPRSGQCEYEVQKIIHLQRIVNELPDAFTDTNRVTKSHVPGSNAPARIEVIPEAITIQRKRGRPIGFKDKNPRKQKEKSNAIAENSQKIVSETLVEVNVPEETTINSEENEVSEETPVPNENEISINYVQDSTMWNQNKTRVDDIFAYAIATDVINENDYVPKNLEECMHRNDWPRWQEATNAELNSLEKRHVFGHVV